MVQAFSRTMGVVVLGLTLGATSSAQGAKDQEERLIHGLPARMRSLTDLTPIGDVNTTLTAFQRTEVLVNWLVEERRTPSPTRTGLGGGPIDTDYIQEQLILSMGLYGDPLAIQWLFRNSSHPELRDDLSVALGIMGDASQVGNLRRILFASQNPYLRRLSTRAMQHLGAVEAIPDLELASEDPFVFPLANFRTGADETYPVREAARGVLMALQRADVLEAAVAQRTKFTDSVRDAAAYRTRHADDLNKMLKVMQSLPRRNSGLSLDRQSRSRA
jgi:hypothetical protein